MPRTRSNLKPSALGALAALVLAGGTLPVAAQYYPPPQAMLGPQHADAIVRSLGLVPVSRAEARGPVFVVHAAGQEGTQVQVTLDRRSGRVMQITRSGYGAPRIASVPSSRAPLYDPEDDEDDFAAFGGDLPPPGAGPHVVTRDSSITGSVQRVAPPVDPLLGVPKQFRGQQRTAARSPESIPRTAPLPRPRPADAPSVAQQETPPAPPAARPKPEDVPDVQGFE